MKNLDCETSRDWIALELYGELDADEHTALARHLADCDDCRRARSALQHGLGRLVSPARAGTTPARERSATGQPRVARAWLTAGAGFAAGVLLSASLALSLGFSLEPAPAGPASSAGSHPTAVASATDFGLAEPPPRAASSGRLAEIQAWMRE